MAVFAFGSGRFSERSVLVRSAWLNGVFGRWRVKKIALAALFALLVLRGLVFARGRKVAVHVPDQALVKFVRQRVGVVFLKRRTDSLKLAPAQLDSVGVKALGLFLDFHASNYAVLPEVLKFVETATRLKVQGSKEELDSLVEAMKFRPPDYWRADSYQIYKMTEGKRGWDGWKRPLAYRAGVDGATCLRGHRDRLVSLAEARDFEVDKTGLLPRPFSGIVPDDVPDNIIAAKFELDNDQRSCVAAWLEACIGICHVTVGGGKTAIFCAAAAMVKRQFPGARFLYFTPTERLVRQVSAEARKFLPDWDITQFGGGVKDETGSDMVVATGAMLHANFDRLKKDSWFSTFMGVLVDESHHAPSPSWQRALLACPSVFRFGASDTLKEDDIVRHSEITGLVGEVLNRVAAAPLIESGRLAKPVVYVVQCHEWKSRFAELPHQAEEGTPAWALVDNQWKRGTYAGPAYELDAAGKIVTKAKKIRRPNQMVWDSVDVPVTIPNRQRLIIDGEEAELESRWCLLERVYDKAIIQFKERNNLIAEWASWYSGKGWPTLVVATRTTHVLILQAVISKLVGEDKVRILFSEHSSAERDDTFQWLEETQGAVLVSPLVKEGVSLNCLRGGVVADPIADWELMRQVLGRFVRPKKDGGANEAHITLFADNQHVNFRRNTNALFKKLETLQGYEFWHPCLKPGELANAQKYTP